MNVKNATLAAAAPAAWSRAFRAGLLDCALAKELRPTELLLGLVLCEETFDRAQDADQAQGRGRIDLEAWARRLGMIERKGLRTDKCALVLGALKALGAVALNPAQATFELRPDASLWSRARVSRARASYGSHDGAVAAALPLRAERELDEAYSQVTRENILRRSGGQAGDNPSGDFAECEPHLTRGSAENSAEDLPGCRRKNPPTQIPPEMQWFGVAAEKSADGAGPARAERSERLIVLEKTNKRSERLNVAAADNSAEVRRAVRAFVGEADFAAHWSRAGYIWNDAARTAVLAGDLRYVQAGVKSGEVKIRKTAGALLWATHGFSWRKRQEER